MTTRSLRSPPAPSLTDHPVTARRPSGLRSKACSSRARPAWGVRSRRAAASSAALPPGPLDPLQPAWAARSVTRSRCSSGPRSWSQYRTRGDSCRMAVTPASARARRCCPSAAAPAAPGSTGAVNAARSELAAVASRLRPPGGAATRRASPPAAGSSHRARFPPVPSPASAAGSGPGPGGAGRGDRNSIPPSGRKAGLSSPSADQVSRAGARAGPAAPVSTRQMLDLNVRPSGARTDTVTASQLPSGDSRRPVSRGRAR